MEFWEAADCGDLAPSLDALNRVSLPVGTGFDPRTLLRATNLLHGLGEERAIRALQTYGAWSESGEHRTEGVELDGTRAILVMRLLFVSRRPDVPLPPPALGRPDVALNPDHCPACPLVLACDIPFLPLGGYHVGGVPASATRLLDLYCRLGRIREQPLRPSCSPVEAADRLVGSAEWRALVPGEQDARARTMVYLQALTAGGTPDAADDRVRSALLAADPPERERLWRRIADDSRVRSLGWDEAAGRFVIGPSD